MADTRADTRTGTNQVPLPCKKCTGYGDAHYLTCPTLRIGADDGTRPE